MKILTVIFLLVLNLPSFAQNQSSEPLTAEKWREDLRVLATELPKRHKNAFFQ